MIVRGRADRGMALVLVLTISLALVLVATPFVLSMILQERGGTMSRYASQAEWGADGAKNFALWKLMYSLDSVERRVGTPYHYDDADDLKIRLDDATLKQKVNVLDPKGPIWGLTVQDEQGKLNVKSAASRSIDRIQAAIDPRVGNPKDYLTLYSGRDSSWGVPQRVRLAQAGAGQASGPPTADSLHVLSWDARVRVTKPGLEPFYAKISSNQLINPGTTGFSTNPGMPPAYVDGVIEVETRHPVNLNTARREVLVALWDGLSLVNIPQSNIDASTALRLANFFYGRTTARLEDFLLRLAQQGLNPEQYRAVALNAVCPTYVSLGRSGTSPLCFRSYDVYTVEADGSMSNPAGVTVAGRGYREVVSVSLPDPQTLLCESQWDFDRQCLALAAAIQRHDLMGYPYGNRIVTYPNLLPSPYPSAPPSKPNGPSDLALKKSQGTNEAFVRAVPSRDFRGESDPNYERDLAQGWPAGTPREHFEHDHEGMKLQGAAHSMGWRRVFSQWPPANQNPQPPNVQPDVAAGGFEFWAKLDAGGATQLLDVRERDWSNRITLRIDGTELVFTACDGTIGTVNNLVDDGAAEIRQPFTPAPETWYHFGAYWKGTRFGHLALLVDGFAHPEQRMKHVNPEGRTISTRLGAALSQTATSVVLRDNILPATGIHPIAVGNEVILVDTGGGTAVRGARNTTAVQHPMDAPVSVFGYTSKVRTGQVTALFGNLNVDIPYDRVPMTNATNRYDFGLDPQAVVIGDKMMVGPPPRVYIDATQTDIGVLVPPGFSIMDFPDQGYLRIDDEIIFYTGRSMTPQPGAMGSNARFTGCVRGPAAQPMSVAAEHDSNAQVRLWSVAVSDTTGFPSPTIIQIDSEWFVVERDAVRPNFWIGFLRTPTTVTNLRRGIAAFQSIPGAHSMGQPVLPTFLVRETHPQINTENLGRDDWVTLTDAMNQKEQAQVHHVSPPHHPMGPMNAGWPEDAWSWQQTWQIASFKAPVSRDYVADDWHVRIMKFPSGELLSLNWLQAADPQFSIGPLSGTIDELKAYASGKQDLELAAEMPASGGTSLQVRLAGGLGSWPNGGLLKIGDEYVGYGQFQGLVASQLRRQWLGSSPMGEVHDAGDKVFSLYWCPVASLAGDLEPTTRFIPLNGRMSGPPQRTRTSPGYTKGYALIDDEIVLFENNGGGTTLDVLPRFDGSGLYRGMFGTRAATHTAGQSLVYGIPWRYWDTYKPREFDNTMSYFQWSAKMDLANWRSVAWTQEIPANDPSLLVHALVRVDAKGEWWDPPGNSDRTILYQFSNGGSRSTINRVGYQNDPGQFDVRFYWEYRQGAFDPAAPWASTGWKRAPKIKEVRVEYDRPLQTLYHEDR